MAGADCIRSVVVVLHNSMTLALDHGCAGVHAAARVASQLTLLAPLVSEMAAAHRRLSLQYLALHKATAKLGYITTSLLAGVIASGFCTVQPTEEAGDGDSR